MMQPRCVYNPCSFYWSFKYISSTYSSVHHFDPTIGNGPSSGSKLLRRQGPYREAAIWL